MAGRRGSTRSVVRLVIAAALVMSGHAAAQQPGSQPTPPLPGPGGPLPAVSPMPPATAPGTPSPTVGGPVTPGPNNDIQAVQAQFVQLAGTVAPIQRFNIK